MSKFTIGIIREGKIPADNRVPLSPRQCHELSLKYPHLDIRVESSKIRCFSDDDYRRFGVGVQETVSDCDLLMGIKEVPVDKLIPGKNYIFFSHTIKKQPHNRKLLQTVLKKKIRLIDYELLTDDQGKRLIGFGRWAGIVGAHYALLMLGKKNGLYDLKQACHCVNFQELVDQYDEIQFPASKFVITGGGRVAGGAIEIMQQAGIEQVNKEDYLHNKFDKPVFVQLHSADLYKRKDGKDFSNEDFHHHAKDYKSIFKPYLSKTDVLIHCSYWDVNAAPLFVDQDILKKDFKTKIIADVSCDIPGPIPTTILHTSSEDPVYGYSLVDRKLGQPYKKDTIDVMAIPNLPNELPRDTSRDFGKILAENIIPLMMHYSSDPIIKRATIAENGKLTPPFEYLQDWIS